MDINQRIGAYLDHEAYVAGAVLIDAKTALRDTAGLLTPDSFQNGLYKAIYAAAAGLKERGAHLDPVTIQEEVNRGGAELSKEECVGLMRNVTTFATLTGHAECIAEAEDARNLRDMFLDAYERLTGGEDLAAVRGDVERELGAVKARGASALVSSREAMESAYRNLMDVSAGQKLFLGSGYGRLNRVLGGGFIKGGLHILAARPGTGKTQLALQIAEHAAAKGVRTLFVSLEMSVAQLQYRRQAVEAGISLGDILSITQEDAEAWGKLSRAVAELSKRPLVFNRVPGLSVPRIERLARSAEAGFVVIDYLGLIAHSGGKSLYERVTETSGALKRMAVALDIPVLCLCQLNRFADGKKPNLSELRDSGAIEQDADTVLLQWLPGGRPEGGDGLTPAELEVIVAKNRHGPLGKVALNWYMACGRIRE